MNFGEKLKYLRLKKGFSQKEIAHELRISQKTLSNIETGTCDIRLKHFVKLGMIIGFYLCDFLTDPS